MSKSGKKPSKNLPQQEPGARANRPLASPLLAEIAVIVAAAVLRNGVVKLLERGHVVQTKEDRERLRTSPARRVAVLGAKKLATHSVPGALMVGAGIVAQSLLRSRTGGKTDALLPSPDTDTGAD